MYKGKTVSYLVTLCSAKESIIKKGFDSVFKQDVSMDLIDEIIISYDDDIKYYEPIKKELEEYFSVELETDFTVFKWRGKPVKIMRVEIGEYGKYRNSAINKNIVFANSTGDYVFFADPESYYEDPETLKKMLDETTLTGLHMVQPEYIYLDNGPDAEREPKHKVFWWYTTLFTRELYEILGGLDNQFRGWGGEDDELFLRVESSIGKHSWAPGTSVVHLKHPRNYAVNGTDSWNKKFLDSQREKKKEGKLNIKSSQLQESRYWKKNLVISRDRFKELQRHRVLITGGRGYVGTHIIDWIKEVDPDMEIFVADRKDGTEYDLTQEKNIDRILEEVKPNTVIHLAGIPHPTSSNTSDYWRMNIKMTYDMAWKSLNSGVSRFIYSSSSAWFGADASFKPKYVPIDEEHPSNIQIHNDVKDRVYTYPCSKIAAEAILMSIAQHAREFNKKFDVIVFRMGPCQGKEAYLGHDPDTMSYVPKSLFAWTDPRDVGDVYYKAIKYKMDYRYEVFHIMGREFTDDFKIGPYNPLDWLQAVHPDCTIDKEFYKTRPKASFWRSDKAVNKLGWGPKH